MSLQKIKGYWEKYGIYAVFCVYVFLTTFSSTAWYVLGEGTAIYTIMKFARHGCYLLFLICAVVKFQQKEYSGEAILYMAALLVLSFIGMFTGKDNSLFLTALFFMFVFGLNSKQLIGMSLLVQGGLLLITVASAFLGLADNSILDPERVRYSLGFNWTTLGSMLYLFVSLQYIFIRKNKINTIECVVMEIINIFFYKFTDTKMSFVTLSTVLIIVLACQLSQNFKTFLKKMLDRYSKLVITLPIIGAFLACWMPLYSSSSRLWQILNRILSGRLQQSKNAIMEYGFSLFGKYIETETHSVKNMGVSDLSYFIDSGYLHFAIKYGVLVLLLLVALYVLSIWKAYRNNDYIMVGIFIVLSVFCIEDLYLVHAFNIFTLYVFCDDDLFKNFVSLKTFCVNKKEIGT